MQETVLGMVLAASPIGENDKRLVILTREYGKIAAFARGAKRTNSPLLACSQPFTFGEFDIFKGKNSYTVVSANVQRYFTELREDLDDIYYGYYFCEMADYYTKENLDGAEVLKLLYQSLRALKVPSITRELVRYIYEWKMFAINGEAPRFFQCEKCGSKENLHYFYLSQGTVRCDLCVEKNEGLLLSDTTLYTLQRIIASPISKLYTFTISGQALDQVAQVVTAYRHQVLSKDFHSLHMIEEK